MISRNPKSPDTEPLDDQIPAICLDLGLGLDMVGDAESLDELLALAEQSLTRDLPAIARLLAQGDSAGASRLLHSFKGFMPIFCVETLVQHVGRVELLSKTASATELQPAYALLEPALQQLCGELRRHLADNSCLGNDDAVS
jgi:HPt (histidine-containing phosphotransfer) domain-containing protein